MEVIDRFY
jgi:WASH complex subunit strumpellin